MELTPSLFEARALLACGASLSAAARATGFADADALDLALWNDLPLPKPRPADRARLASGEAGSVWADAAAVVRFIRASDRGTALNPKKKTSSEDMALDLARHVMGAGK
jgi:hypothetical protein